MDILNAEFTRLLTNSGWKQSEAARHLELSPAVITRYLNNDTRPSMTVLKLFKLVIGDTHPLPGEHPATLPDGLLDRPLDAVEQQLIAQLRRLDEAQRRRVAQGFCTVLTALATGESTPMTDNQDGMSRPKKKTATGKGRAG